jgi:amino acid transporter
LAEWAQVLGGTLFKYAVVIDAFLVLSGAVLTSYIGVSGLINRMALDDTLPAFLARPNKRGTYPRIVMSFFVLCSSILLLTRGNLLSLAGVYTISFLGVMSMFAFGNLILKRTRKTLKRTYHAPALIVVLAFLATFFGIFGNIRIDTQNFVFFEIYFIPAILLVFLVINQEYILRFALKITKIAPALHRKILAFFRDLTQGTVVVFVHNCHRLQLILDYIKRNESNRSLLLIVCENE